MQQGTSSSGQPKFRRIDDHADNENNAASERRQNVPMAGINDSILMIRLIAEHFNQSEAGNLPTGGAEDMQAAYRQCPLHPSLVSFALTCVYNPDEDKVDIHEMWGQPFGSEASVPNFLRLAEWACRASRRLLHLVLDHFFDDFFLVEPEWASSVGLWSFRRCLHTLGFRLDPEKRQLPVDSFKVLGVRFVTSALATEGLVKVEPLASRVLSLRQDVSLVLEKGTLTPSQAARLVGRYGFLSETIFGRVGRVATRSLRKRQYQKHPPFPVTPELVVSLHLMCAFLDHAPSRQLRITKGEQASTLLYTDASEGPDKDGNTTLIIGAVLFSPTTTTPLYTSARVPHRVIAAWTHNKNTSLKERLLRPSWLLTPGLHCSRASQFCNSGTMMAPRHA